MSGTVLGENKMVTPKREESYVCITCFLKDENKMVQIQFFSNTISSDLKYDSKCDLKDTLHLYI